MLVLYAVSPVLAHAFAQVGRRSRSQRTPTNTATMGGLGNSTNNGSVLQKCNKSARMQLISYQMGDDEGNELYIIGADDRASARMLGGKWGHLFNVASAMGSLHAVVGEPVGRACSFLTLLVQWRRW